MITYVLEQLEQYDEHVFCWRMMSEAGNVSLFADSSLEPSELVLCL